MRAQDFQVLLLTAFVLPRWKALHVGLSNEVKQKLSEAKPESLARASRLPGVTPAAISLLMVHLKKERQAVG